VLIHFRKGWHSYALGLGRLTIWLRHREIGAPWRWQVFIRRKGEPFS
jgi:hypothetical protein